MRNKLAYLFLFVSFFHFGQEVEPADSAYFTRFRDKIVLYTDIGYTSAPFRVVYPFPGDTKSLKYKHNISPVLGFGVAYKWFSLRLGFALKGTTRSVSRFGKSTYFDLGTQFQIKNWYFTLDARQFRGYAIKDAYKWNDSLTKLIPNDLRPKTQTFAIALNSWYFFNENMNMHSVFGRTGHYERALGTPYIKPTINIHGVSNDQEGIIPDELTIPIDDKTQASLYSAIDVGIVPGYAYVNRINNWQFCGFFGLGGVIQAKFYTKGTIERGFLGLAPRYDVKLYGGYSVPRFFAFLSLDFDNKTIRYTNLKYRQNHFTFRITGGIRLDKKKNRNIKN